LYVAVTLPVPVGSRAPFTPSPNVTVVLWLVSSWVTKTFAVAGWPMKLGTSVQATPSTKTWSVLVGKAGSLPAT
jgi:hypothetical protein